MIVRVTPTIISGRNVEKKQSNTQFTYPPRLVLYIPGSITIHKLLYRYLRDSSIHLTRVGTLPKLKCYVTDTNI